MIPRTCPLLFGDKAVMEAGSPVKGLRKRGQTAGLDSEFAGEEPPTP